MKPLDRLALSDLQAHPVWRFAHDEQADETVVTPLKRTPVSSLSGKLVATEVRLANDSCVWALLGNIEANNARMNEHFLTLSVYHAGRRFMLARYHDVDFDRFVNGPAALARFLGLGLGDVFPISYDLRRYVKGTTTSLLGTILPEPTERLTREEMVRLVVG